MELQTDPYPQETSWDLITVDGDTLIVMNGFEEQNTLYVDSICVPDVAITFNLYDTYGDGLTSSAEIGNSICMYVVLSFQALLLSIYLAEHSQVVMV